MLRDLAALHGVEPEDTSRALSEAAAQGITIETETGAIWFRHPLLAETIAGSIRAQERADLHSDLAARWHAAVGVDERDRANFLALHYVAAGDSDQAFTWSLRAADEAAAIRARDEEASHLSTAVSLLDRLSDEVASTVDDIGLLTRAGRASEGAGDFQNAVRHYESALAQVERTTRDPLQASRILLELHVAARPSRLPFAVDRRAERGPRAHRGPPRLRGTSPGLRPPRRRGVLERKRRRPCTCRDRGTARGAGRHHPGPCLGPWHEGTNPVGQRRRCRTTRYGRSPWRWTTATHSS